MRLWNTLLQESKIYRCTKWTFKIKYDNSSTTTGLSITSFGVKFARLQNIASCVNGTNRPGCYCTMWDGTVIAHFFFQIQVIVNFVSEIWFTCQCHHAYQFSIFLFPHSIHFGSNTNGKNCPPILSPWKCWINAQYHYALQEHVNVDYLEFLKHCYGG